MSTDVLRALIRAGWRGDATTDMGDVTEHVLTHPAAGVALSVRPDGQIVGVEANGAPDALAGAVRAVAAALGGETAPLDLAALSRLAADAGLPWEHDGGGEIVRAGAGSAGWVAETLHGADPDATRRYAEYIVAACNAVPALVAELARLRATLRDAVGRKLADADAPEWRRCRDCGSATGVILMPGVLTPDYYRCADGCRPVRRPAGQQGGESR